MRGLFPARITDVSGESVVERLTIDILRMGRKMPRDRRGKIFIRSIGHSLDPTGEASAEFATS